MDLKTLLVIVNLFGSTCPLYIDLCRQNNGTFEDDGMPTRSTVSTGLSLVLENCTMANEMLVMALDKMSLILDDSGYLTACGGLLSFKLPGHTSSLELCMFQQNSCIVLMSERVQCSQYETTTRRLGCGDVFEIINDVILPLNITYKKFSTDDIYSFKMTYLLTRCGSQEESNQETSQYPLSTTARTGEQNENYTGVIFGILFGITLSFFILVLFILYRWKMKNKNTASKNVGSSGRVMDNTYSIVQGSISQVRGESDTNQNDLENNYSVIQKQTGKSNIATSKKEMVVNQLYHM
ncbi:uncharacterized protein LOC144431425 isoform X2 [Styela clava]